MPEGHTVHRVARQFERDFVGHRVEASSPQGRFAQGAALISGSTLRDAKAQGKHLFLGFDDDRWLRVHLGIYGAWDFFGVVTPPEGQSASGSMGAPRLRRAVRMAETEHEREVELQDFPPEPVGQVRVRLNTGTSLADLRGPAACEVLDPAEVNTVLARLGPDPLGFDTDLPVAERTFVERAGRKNVPIGQVLMDQSVVSGIGNVYRAEMLFRAALNPYTPARQVRPELIKELWWDWVGLLTIGVETGQMMTMDFTDSESWQAALRSRDDRHWVYKREGLPCRVCGTNINLDVMAARKLYWCPSCQA